MGAWRLLWLVWLLVDVMPFEYDKNWTFLFGSRTFIARVTLGEYDSSASPEALSESDHVMVSGNGFLASVGSLHMVNLSAQHRCRTPDGEN